MIRFEEFGEKSAATGAEATEHRSARLIAAGERSGSVAASSRGEQPFHEQVAGSQSIERCSGGSKSGPAIRVLAEGLASTAILRRHHSHCAISPPVTYGDHVESIPDGVLEQVRSGDLKQQRPDYQVKADLGCRRRLIMTAQAKPPLEPERGRERARISSRSLK